jgi:hypothetical protein
MRLEEWNRTTPPARKLGGKVIDIGISMTKAKIGKRKLKFLSALFKPRQRPNNLLVSAKSPFFGALWFRAKRIIVKK